MSNLKAGDKVIVTHKVTSEEGWDNTWSHGMDNFIGRSGKVVQITSGGVLLDIDSYRFPPSSLSLVMPSKRRVLSDKIEQLQAELKAAIEEFENMNYLTLAEFQEVRVKLVEFGARPYKTNEENYSIYMDQEDVSIDVWQTYNPVSIFLYYDSRQEVRDVVEHFGEEFLIDFYKRFENGIL